MSLRALAPDLWVADHPLVVGGLHLGARATLVRGADGGLTVIAPVPFAAPAEVDGLGPVRALVAPNRMHWMYLGAAQQRWPEARVYAAPGVSAKAKGLRIDAELGGETPDGLVAIPVHGMPAMGETVFYHPPSRSLIVTDLAFNLRGDKPWFTRTFLRLNNAWDRFGPSRIFQTMVKDRAALRGSLDAMLAHPFERVVVTHGDVLDADAVDVFRAAYAWV